MNLTEQIAQVADEIKQLKARERDLYRQSVEAPEAEKVCADWMAEELAHDPAESILFREALYPIEVNGISFEGAELWRERPGGHRLVAVRPCGDPGDGQTFLGILIGDVALSVGTTFNRDTGMLNFGLRMHNPAIFVPDLQRVVYGCGSWWSTIKTADQLREITDGDIDSVWYVQALKVLSGNETERMSKTGLEEGELVVHAAGDRRVVAQWHGRCLSVGYHDLHNGEWLPDPNSGLLMDADERAALRRLLANDDDDGSESA